MFRRVPYLYMNRRFYRRSAIVFSSLFISFLVYFFYLRPPVLPPEFVELYSLLVNHSKSDNGKCQLIVPDPWDSSILSHLGAAIPLKCKQLQPDLVLLKDGWLLINSSAVSGSLESVNCKWRSFTHNDGVDDNSVLFADNWQSFENGKSLMQAQFAHVQCNENGLLKRTIYNYHFAQSFRESNSNAQPEEDEQKGNRFTSHPKESSVSAPNVILFGVDSMSRSNFIRQLPKTHKYLMETMGAVEMTGYTKVWDNTYGNVVPMLTNKYVGWGEEFARDIEDKWNMYYDNWTEFIWTRFARGHYATYLAEDRPDIHLFNYLGKLNGFKYQPTTFYSRTYWLEAFYSMLRRRSSAYCYNTQPEHQLMIQWLQSFLSSYSSERKWAFSWSQGLSHELLNQISVADQDFVEFFQAAHKAHFQKNTILMVLSDHGHRYASIRQTIVGRIEVRMPYLSIYISPDLQSAYPHLMANLRANAALLSTPFDIYSTMKSLIDKRFLKHNIQNSAVRKERSYSLISDRVPQTRSCHQASIPRQYCPCYRELAMSNTSALSQKVAAQFVTEINTKLLDLRVCHRYKMSMIRDVSAFLPNEQTVKDPQTGDLLPASGLLVNVRVQLELDPNAVLVEGVLVRDYSQTSGAHSKFVLVGDVNRNNAYGNTSWCVTGREMRKFCTCK